MNIKIVSRWDSERVIYEGDAESLKNLLVKALNEGANLSDANLSDANLSNADLIGANLSDANLSGAKIDGEQITKAPLMIKGLHYWVLITEGFMRIGCKRFTHQEWSEFKDPTIAAMDSKALEFWNEWKEPLMMMCEKHSIVAEAA